MIYDQNKINTDHTINEFNKLQPTIKFTTEKEQQESINFLDLTIHRKDKKLQFLIYRKPTQTDIIIPSNSCHPYEHKLLGINYLLYRLHTYPTTEKATDAEKNTSKAYYIITGMAQTLSENHLPSGNKKKIRTLIHSTKKQSGLPSHTAAKK
jgi:hypothetical protein